jgi:hypothetical protein
MFAAARLSLQPRKGVALRPCRGFGSARPSASFLGCVTSSHDEEDTMNINTMTRTQTPPAVGATFLSCSTTL